MHFSACAHNGLSLVFGYLHLYLRKLENLLLCLANYLCVGKAATARTATARSMDNLFVRIINLPERGSFVPVLPTGLFAGFFTQTLRRASKPFSGGGLATVVAVFGYHGFKLGNPVFQCLDRLLKCVKKGISGFEAFIVYLSELLFFVYFQEFYRLLYQCISVE